MDSPAIRTDSNVPPLAALRAPRDRSSPQEIAYLIEADEQVRETLFTELTLAGVTVRTFDSVNDFRNCTRRDGAACLIVGARLLEAGDFNMQGELTDPDCPPTIVVSTHPDIQSGVRAIKAGAIDFLVHPVRLDALLLAVSEAFSRDGMIRQQRADTAQLHTLHSRLTRREREVFSLIVSGFLNKQAASMLNISLVTVQIHRGHVMRKMRAQSFAELVCMAIKLRLL